MTATTTRSQSSTAQTPSLDQAPAQDERINPNDTGSRRTGRRGRGGNSGSGGNVNTSRNRTLFYGSGRFGGDPGRGGPGAGTGAISRRGRGRLRSDASNTTRTVAGMGRLFGGQLTREEPQTADDGGSDKSLVQVEQATLRPNAPEFIPGVHVATPTPTPTTTSTHTPTRNWERTRQPRPPKAKSTASDIATRTHEDITNGVYECPICTSELGRKTKVWSCSLCWTVFHLSCIKKWSNNEGSVMARPRQQQGQDGHDHPRQWRCPGCNLPHDILPSTRAPRPGKGAPIPAILYVMQALVRPARPWAQRSFVFVDAMSRQRDVLTPTTRMGGVAGSHAASYCPVLSISVLVLVMKAFAAPVRRLLRQHVTVESLRRK
ncbi:nuclear transcription factor [Histoplasma capsulatum var. duboisii H88]|uniref:Nuclear transcription factor n=2 Tax=Ajellomyces capsulatus TaxID=5037 RepID=F0UT93_AJEC8|nr:NF-X1 type Zn finger-containing protein [Histoplasma capsulatum H143]EGC49120.1 nuclear transcription factor [Histoplasma capsulatum var. duboisii H88]